MPWASYSNSSSFWLTKKSLALALMHAGFGLVLEQHDYSAPAYDLWNLTRSRCMFLALKMIDDDHRGQTEVLGPATFTPNIPSRGRFEHLMSARGFFGPGKTLVEIFASPGGCFLRSHPKSKPLRSM